MALVSLFFQTRAKIGQLDIDASIQESHEATATVTKNEVEKDSLIADHVTLENDKLVMEVVISKTPLGTSALVGSAATAVGGLVGKSLGGFQSITGQAANIGIGSIGGLISNAVNLDDGGVASTKGKSRDPKDVYQYLLELRNRRMPIEVVTALRIYTDMILTQVSVPRNIGNREVLRANVTFEQIKIVTAQSVSGIGGLSSLGGKAEEAQKLGKQSAGETSPKIQSDATLLHQFFIGG